MHHERIALFFFFFSNEQEDRRMTRVERATLIRCRSFLSMPMPLRTARARLSHSNLSVFPLEWLELLEQLRACVRKYCARVYSGGRVHAGQIAQATAETHANGGNVFAVV